MAILRQEIQQYEDVAALVAETLVPTNNDYAGIENTNRLYHWRQGSTKPHDGKYVIDQTATTALGRWELVATSSILYGTANSSAMENGQQSVTDITVTGVLATDAVAVAVTSANTFPDNVFVVSTSVSAVDKIRVVLDNQTGDAVAAQTIDVTVLVF